MRDYWLSKLFFDLQAPAIGAEYRADREKVLARYQISPEARRAILNDDVGELSKRVNPYLLRFYFVVAGMSEAEFLKRLRAVAPKEAAHG
jgi:Aromatic-ring-opening dioxygenase LigAB, LigA subunit